MFENLVEALVNMRETEAISLAKELIENGSNVLEVLDSCRMAMEAVGKRFEKGEYFLPELILAGEMLGQISEIAKPKLKGEVKFERLGKVVLGTVEGDIHDIGKNIVAFMLDVNGFEVHDLGIDVPVQRFVDAIREIQPKVVGLSGFLTLAFDSMKKTIEGVAKAGLRNQVKIMIGGGQIDGEVRKHTGADGYGLNAMDAVKLAQEWIVGRTR